MMVKDLPIKKSEDYNSLWKSYDELRDRMDAPNTKNYVFVLLFVKYFSDRYLERTMFRLRFQ